MAADVKAWVVGTREYVNDLKLEMRRVTWPNRKQVEGTTAVVIISVFVFAAYFAVVDNILTRGLNAVLRFFGNYRPQFYFRTTDVTGIVKLQEGTEMVMPGDNVSVEVELIVPIAMEEKLRFAIREGGRTVGAGVVTKILE